MKQVFKKLDVHLNCLHGVVLMSVTNPRFGQLLDAKNNTYLNSSHTVALMTEKETKKIKINLGHHLNCFH